MEGWEQRDEVELRLAQERVKWESIYRENLQLKLLYFSGVKKRQDNQI